MFDPRPLTATVDRYRLVSVLDFVADAVGELERLGGDPDLVAGLRAVIAEVAADLEAADALDGHGSPDDAVGRSSTSSPRWTTTTSTPGSASTEVSPPSASPCHPPAGPAG